MLDDGREGPDLRRIVGGLFDVFDVDGSPVGSPVYLNDTGVYSCAPNRAVYATGAMVSAGYAPLLSDGPLAAGELYCVLYGDLVVVGFDRGAGEDRSLTDGELAQAASYFTDVAGPGSGLAAACAVMGGMTHITRGDVEGMKRYIRVGGGDAREGR